MAKTLKAPDQEFDALTLAWRTFGAAFQFNFFEL